MSGPKRGPNVPPEVHERVVRDFLARQKAKAEQDAADQRLAEEAGVPVSAIRQARAEKAAAELATKRDRDLAVARVVVGLPAEPTRMAGRKRPGPPLMVSREEVAATRARLEAEDRPSGERSIATALGVSREAVRHALGKR